VSPSPEQTRTSAPSFLDSHPSRRSGFDDEEVLVVAVVVAADDGRTDAEEVASRQAIREVWCQRLPREVGGHRRPSQSVPMGAGFVAFSTVPSGMVISSGRKNPSLVSAWGA